jgi:aspartate/methionine/tyrosine aminotransferase
MFDIAKNIEGVISLGLGEPDFDTPKHIREAAKCALDEGYTRYPPSAGFDDLKEAISKKLRSENEIVADPSSEIIITVGAMQGIFYSILHLIDPGDEVIVIDPGYDYYSQIGLFGGVPVPVPVYKENSFRVDPHDIARAVTNKTKLIILNSPSNPTGAVFDKEILLEIAKIVNQHGLFVLSDEPYEKIIFDAKQHISFGSLDGMKDWTISVFTFSKTYAMPGWRVGYVTANKTIVDEIEKLMEHMTSGVTTVSQRAALAALQKSQLCVQEMLKAYEERRNIIYKELNGIDGVSCVLPAGTFYAFPNVTKLGMKSWDLAKYLAKDHKIVTVPGRIFGRKGEGHLRISFAADIPFIQEAMRRLRIGIESIII